MWTFWAVSFLMACIGGVFWYTSKRIAMWEWLIGAGVAFALAAGCQVVCVSGMLSDKETLSGRITEVRHIPAWVEYYEYAVYRTETRTGTRTVTDSKGHSRSETYTYTVQVFDHWQPTSRKHAEKWLKKDNFSREWGIDSSEYAALVKLFGKEQAVEGKRKTGEHASRLKSGDPQDYLGANVNGWLQPVTIWKPWENRIKAAPSVFSFPPVPPEAKVFEYPANDNPFVSNRLLGTASETITTLAWDQMNGRLGPSKKVNVIAVGFGPSDSSIAEQQRAKWIGGRKNDLVLCYGGPDRMKPAWARVFGWSDSDICKRKIETILLDNSVDNSIIPAIEKLVQAEYTIKDWHDFDYLRVEPPESAYWWFFGTILVVQGCLWAFFFRNQEHKQAQPA